MPIAGPQLTLSPVSALRAIRRIATDTAMSPAQRLAAIAVVLAADSRSGLAWMPYRTIAAEYGISGDTVRRVLGGTTGAAIGSHLAVEKHGTHNSACYRVLGGEADQCTEDRRTGSASKIGARIESAAPVRRNRGSSAPTVGATLAPYSGPTTQTASGPTDLLGETAEPRPKATVTPQRTPAEVPPVLDTPEFRAAWAEWVAYRRQRRSPLTPATVARQLAMLAKLGPAPAVACIHQSIEAGWAGLFEPRPGTGAQTNVNPARVREGADQYANVARKVSGEL